MRPTQLATILAGASNAVTYPAKTTGYSQDFSGIADNSKLYTQSGWGAYDTAAGSTNSARDLIYVLSAQLRYLGSSYSTAPGAVVVMRDAGSTDHVVRCKLVTLPTGGANFTLVYGATHMQNSLFVNGSNDASASGLSTVKNVAGTASTVFGQVLANTALGRALQAGDVLESRTIGSVAWHYVNGICVSAAAGNSIAGFTKGQFVGFGTFAASNGQVWDDFYCAPLACQITVSTFGAFIPGTEAAGGRTLQAAGTYVGTLLDIDYRVRNASTLTVVQDWRRASNKTIAAGAWTADVFVPLGDIATNPMFVMEVRAANDTDATDRSAAFAVGLAWLAWGQSNSDNRRLALMDSTTSNAYTYVSEGTPNSTIAKVWKQKTGGGEALVAATGRPCGFMYWGVGAQELANLVPSSVVTIADSDGTGLTQTFWLFLVGHLAKSRMSGAIQGWLWVQGEAEGMQSSFPNVTTYKTKFSTELVPAMAAHCVPGAKFAITMLGNYNATPPDVPAYNASSNAIRQALYELATGAGGLVGHSWLACTMADTYHFTTAGYAEGNRRAALTFAKEKTGTGYNGRGPLITGATRSGATITLAVNLNGAASIAGSALGGYDVSTDDFATLKTITSVNVSGGTIVIVLAADPGAAVKVRSFAGANYGTPTLAIGTYADASTIPVEPLFIPITAA